MSFSGGNAHFGTCLPEGAGGKKVGDECRRKVVEKIGKERGGKEGKRVKPSQSYLGSFCSLLCRRL